MYFIHLSQFTARQMILHMAFIRSEYVKMLWDGIGRILERNTFIKEAYTGNESNERKEN